MLMSEEMEQFFWTEPKVEATDNPSNQQAHRKWSMPVSVEYYWTRVNHSASSAAIMAEHQETNTSGQVERLDAKVAVLTRTS